MRNVTISLPDDVYKKARLRAAEKDTSISGLMRELLLKETETSHAESEFERRKREMNQLFEAIELRYRETGESFNASDRLSREDLYDRKAFR